MENKMLENRIDSMVEAYMVAVDCKEGAAPFHSLEHILETFRFFERYGDFILDVERSGQGSLLLDRMNGYMDSYVAHPGSDFLRRAGTYLYAGALYNIFIQWLVCGKAEDALISLAGRIAKLGNQMLAAV